MIKMKILFVITRAEVGGATMSVLNLAREMKRRGHEVMVGFGDGNFLPGELDKENISYVRFKYLMRTHNPLANFMFVGEVKKFLAGKDFKVVHFNSSNALFGTLGVKLADNKIKTVFTFRGMSMLDEHYKKEKYLKFFYFCFFKFFCLFVDRPVFVSAENLRKFGQGRLTKRGILIYNGLDPKHLDFLPRAEAREALSQEEKINLNGKYLIGSIGRLEYAKNYEFLVNVFPEILKIKPEAAVAIIGGGPDEEKLKQLIAEKGLVEKIILFGNIPHASRFIKGFDLFVLPSRYEGLSITLIEALFAEARILTTRVGGNPETAGCEDEIYDLDDRAGFLEKFKKLQDFGVQISVDVANKKRSANFLLEKTADGYERIYQ
jgi:glycosyltransferase involved in cell wall biosynthesis